MINLTPTPVSAELAKANVRDLPSKGRAQLLACFDFSEVPTPATLRERARQVAALCPVTQRYALVGDPPYLAGYLADELAAVGVESFYAYIDSDAELAGFVPAHVPQRLPVLDMLSPDDYEACPDYDPYDCYSNDFKGYADPKGTEHAD